MLLTEHDGDSWLTDATPGAGWALSLGGAGAPLCRRGCPRSEVALLLVPDIECTVGRCLLGERQPPTATPTPVVSGLF